MRIHITFHLLCRTNYRSVAMVRVENHVCWRVLLPLPSDHLKIQQAKTLCRISLFLGGALLTYQFSNSQRPAGATQNYNKYIYGQKRDVGAEAVFDNKYNSSLTSINQFWFFFTRKAEWRAFSSLFLESKERCWNEMKRKSLFSARFYLLRSAYFAWKFRRFFSRNCIQCQRHSLVTYFENKSFRVFCSNCINHFSSQPFKSPPFRTSWIKIYINIDFVRPAYDLHTLEFSCQT